MIKVDNYEKAYAEVIEVLKYIPMNEYNKIPKKYIKFMEENCSETSPFVYNIALSFEKQNISNEAKNILGMIFRLFIVEQSKKEKLSSKDKELKEQEELEKYMKYNPDNLFKKDNTDKVLNNVQTNSLIETKDSIFKKIWNKIKNLFKK